ncbi:MAG: DsrE/DsrF/DrsH-like family protein [Syntrophotaleaceae bacterium]
MSCGREALSITASDPGFYGDAPQPGREAQAMWFETSRCKRASSKAVIEKAGLSPEAVPAAAGNDKAIIFSGNLDKVIASFIIANGALSMGRKVTLFFTFWGLNALRKPSKVKACAKTSSKKPSAG